MSAVHPFDRRTEPQHVLPLAPHQSSGGRGGEPPKHAIRLAGADQSGGPGGESDERLQSAHHGSIALPRRSALSPQRPPRTGQHTIERSA